MALLTQVQQGQFNKYTNYAVIGSGDLDKPSSHQSLVTDNDSGVLKEQLVWVRSCKTLKSAIGVVKEIWQRTKPGTNDVETIVEVAVHGSYYDWDGTGDMVQAFESKNILVEAWRLERCVF